MFNISPQELLLILVLALLVVGPKRLPELGRTLGKGLRELRRAQDDVRKTIQVNLDDESPERPHRRSPPLPAAESDPDEASPDGRAASGSDHAAPAAAGAAAGSGVSEISKTLGRSLAELRRAREEIQRSFRVDVDDPGAPPPATPRPSSTGADPAERTDRNGGSLTSDEDAGETPG